MDLETQALNVWIALGTLSGLGVIVAIIKTWAWYSKSGKEIIDLSVRTFFFVISMALFS